VFKSQRTIVESSTPKMSKWHSQCFTKLIIVFACWSSQKEHHELINIQDLIQKKFKQSQSYCSINPDDMTSSLPRCLWGPSCLSLFNQTRNMINEAADFLLKRIRHGFKWTNISARLQSRRSMILRILLEKRQKKNRYILSLV